MTYLAVDPVETDGAREEAYLLERQKKKPLRSSVSGRRRYAARWLAEDWGVATWRHRATKEGRPMAGLERAGVWEEVGVLLKMLEIETVG